VWELGSFHGGDGLMVDGFEKVSALEGWFRERLLPQAPRGSLLVLAGRTRLDHRWHRDPGWQRTLEVLDLEPFSEKETREYLRRRGVPDQATETIIRESRGFPLALSLLAEVAIQQRGEPLGLCSNPQGLVALLETFLDDAPSALHARALFASSVVHHVTEPLLASMLEIDSADALYTWLSKLTFMKPTEMGLRPHDLIRQLLLSLLDAHSPGREPRLRAAAARYYIGLLKEPSSLLRPDVDEGIKHLIAGFDPAFTSGLHDEELSLQPVRNCDWPAIEEMVARHEGEGSLHVLRHWRWRGAEVEVVLRDESECVGFLLRLDLCEAEPEDLSADPGVAAVHQNLRERGILPASRSCMLMRMIMSRDGHQQISPVHSLLFSSFGTKVVSSGCDYGCSVIADPDVWRERTREVTPQVLEGVCFEIDGRAYGFLEKDFRCHDGATWPRQFLEEIVRSSLREPLSPAPAREVLPTFLEPEAFRQAVRDAFRVVDRPDLLKDSLLLRLVLVTRDAAGDGLFAKTNALASLLRDETERFRRSAREAHYFHVLHRAYFDPPVKLAVAARELGMGYSTLRRHMRQAVTLVAERLLARELDARGL
ncbi:MAG: hypothetical protein ACOCVR_01765, partial [Myxococcota bacterium]